MWNKEALILDKYLVSEIHKARCAGVELEIIDAIWMAIYANEHTATGFLAAARMCEPNYEAKNIILNSVIRARPELRGRWS